jgi:hypothetical protein
MKVTLINENDDGSVDVTLEDIEPPMMQLLLQEGFMAILSKELKRLKKEKKIPALFKGNPDAV